MTRAALFDCDSTLSAVEGIDALAERANVADQVVPLTKAAMDGSLALEEVYARRLDLIRPSLADIDWLGRLYVERRTAGAAETVAALQALGWQVHIVSAGVRQAVLALAASLDIAADHVHAVALTFDADGEYRDFDRASPLSQAGGKAVICRQVLESAESAIMVGDGVTDLEAQDAGVPVIGFGGVVRREQVAAQASKYVEAPELTAVLDAMLTPDERAWCNAQTATP
jgi:phosphoserine phosphatase